MSRRSKLSIIIGVVVLTITCLVFAIARPEFYPSTGLGFAFLLYSEVVFFGSFVLLDYWAKKSLRIMTGAGAGIPIWCYAGIVFVSSLIYMNLHSVFVRGFLILQLLLLAVVVVVVLVAGYASQGAAGRDAKVLQAKAAVDGFLDELALIREMTDQKAEIDHLIEELKYSDMSAMVDADVELGEAIPALERVVSADKFDKAEFDKAVKNIDFLIKKRKLQVKSTKRGGI